MNKQLTKEENQTATRVRTCSNPVIAEECKLNKEVLFYTHKNGKIINSCNSNY